MGSGFRTFQSGEVLTADNVQNYLMDQAVMVFAGTAERGSALPSPEVGMTAYSTATGMQVWDGSAWVNVGGAGIADFSDAATGTYSSGGFNYKYITYTASGTLTVTEAGFADVLIVAGGGGGSQRGGGGAGGHLLVTDSYLPVGTLTVTVGAGGVGDTAFGFNGGSSRVGSYTAVGGGGGTASGSGGGDPNGLSGGSGGGGRTAGGAGVSGQGSAGGTGASGAGGGGGGASAVGANATTNNGGAGGAGTSTSLDNSATTRAGGGGGAGTSSGGAGGAGGGGAGSTTTATAGTVNTGGGGGGGATTGAAGGSGIVIVRVKV